VLVMNRLPKGMRGQVGISFGTLQSGIRAICRATSKGYTIKLLPTSFQRGSKGGERRHRGLARRRVAVRRRAVLMATKGERPQPRRAAPLPNVLIFSAAMGAVCHCAPPPLHWILAHRAPWVGVPAMRRGGLFSGSNYMP
jgi:hypothetical protein